MEKLPINSDVLADVRFESTVLSTYISRHKKNALKLVGYAEELSEPDALKLECVLQVRDIKKCARDIKFYLSMAEMLLENINSDLNSIFSAREELKNDIKKKEARTKDAIRHQRFRDKKAQKSAS